MNRRNFLMRTTAGAAALAVGGAVAGQAAAQQTQAAQQGSGAVNGTQRRPLRLDREIDELQERTFRWFEKVTDRRTGLTPD
ncbi:MAG: twin-arginine translocation signal domain-containing protein, partial [Brevundimonas sp.]